MHCGNLSCQLEARWPWSKSSRSNIWEQQTFFFSFKLTGVTLINFFAIRRFLCHNIPESQVCFIPAVFCIYFVEERLCCYRNILWLNGFSPDHWTLIFGLCFGKLWPWHTYQVNRGLLLFSTHILQFLTRFISPIAPMFSLMVHTKTKFHIYILGLKRYTYLTVRYVSRYSTHGSVHFGSVHYFSYT